MIALTVIGTPFSESFFSSLGETETISAFVRSFGIPGDVLLSRSDRAVSTRSTFTTFVPVKVVSERALKRFLNTINI